MNGKLKKILALVLALSMVLSVGSVFAEEGEQVKVEAGSGEIEKVERKEDIETVNKPAIDVVAQDGGVAVVDVDADVETYNQTAVEIDAENGGVAVVEVEDVDVVSTDGFTSPTAVDIDANNGRVSFEADDVTVTTNKEEGKENPTSIGVDIDTNGPKSDVDVKVKDVDADVGVTITEKDGGEVDVTTNNIYATTEGVYINSQPSSEEESDVTEDEINAIDLTDLRVEEYYNSDGTVTKRIYMSDGSYYDVIYKDGKIISAKKTVRKGEAGEVNFTAKGNIDVRGEFARDGMYINADVKGTEINAEVTGDIIVTQTDSKESYSQVDGVQEHDVSSTVNIDVGGTIDVTGNNSAKGADLNSIHGNVTMNVGEDINVQGGKQATGVDVDAWDNAEVEFNVGGKITATQSSVYRSKDDPDAKKKADERYSYSATGMDLDATGKSSITANVEGGVEAISDEYATGVSIYANGGSDVSLTVGGDGINAEGEKNATGLYVYTVDNKTNVDVNVTEGGVHADGGKDADGVISNNYGGTQTFEITGDVTSSGDGLELRAKQPYNWVESDAKLPIVESEYRSFYKTTDKDGNEITVKRYTHYEGDTVYHYDSLGNVWVEKVTDEKAESETRVEVIGDVIAEEAAIVFDVTNDKAKMDVIVDGTVSGELASVLLEERTVTDNITLTVWAITENENGNLVERYRDVMNDKGEMEHVLLGGDEDFEKEIQYIIKVEQPELGTLTADGTYEYEGYDVAHQGDEVTLRVDLPFGYRVKEAFNGTENKVKLGKNANGQYYLLVPRGGGVMLSVTLERVPSKVTYYTEGGTINDSEEPYTIRSVLTNTITLLDAPVWEGHEFLYWNIQTVAKDNEKWVAPDPANDKQYAPGDKYYLKNEVVTITAVWAN